MKVARQNGSLLNLHSSCESHKICIRKKGFTFVSLVLVSARGVQNVASPAGSTSATPRGQSSRWEGINNNLYRLDVNIQCSIYYPVVAASYQCLSIFQLALRLLSPCFVVHNEDVIAIQFVMGLWGAIFSPPLPTLSTCMLFAGSGLLSFLSMIKCFILSCFNKSLALSPLPIIFCALLEKVLPESYRFNWRIVQRQLTWLVTTRDIPISEDVSQSTRFATDSLALIKVLKCIISLSASSTSQALQVPSTTYETQSASH